VAAGPGAPRAGPPDPPAGAGGQLIQAAGFQDRFEGGRALAEELTGYAGRDDVVVLALPRGGVPVGFEVAQALGVALDVFMVRKLGVPGHEELALGAIATGGIRVLNHDVVAAVGIAPEDVELGAARELAELERRELSYRDGRPALEVRGKAAIVVDDGLATGATMRAAATALRSREAARIVVAVPIAPAQTCQALRELADEVVCPLTPEPFTAVGRWYRDFSPVGDEEVRALLRDRRLA
jgi:putative phosphoribosyl transferase